MISHRHRVDVLAPPKTRGSRNETTGTWEVLDTLNCSITPLAGRELELARQTVGNATHEFEMYQHHKFVLNPSKRLRLNGRLFDIGYVKDPDESGRKWQALCTEEINGSD